MSYFSSFSFRKNDFFFCKFIKLFVDLCKSKFHLSIATICLGATCIGLTIGWPEISSSFYIDIEYSNSTCCVKAEKIKWTTRLALKIGSCLGALLPVFFVDTCGRKSNFVTSAYFNLMSWFIFIFTDDNLFYLLGTAIGGLSAGTFAVTTAIYVTEITPPNTRSTVGTLVAFFAYSGIFFGTSLSVYIHNRLAPLIICLFTSGFIFSASLLMIESPFLLYQHGKTLEAKIALKKLRGVEKYLQVDEEFKVMAGFFKSKSQLSLQSSIYDDKYLPSAFVDIKSRQWIIWIMFILFLTQLIGSYALEQFTTNFIENIFPYFGNMLLAFLDIISIALFIYLANKIGRKRVIIISISGLSFSCFMFAIDTVFNKFDNKIFTANTRVFPFIIIFLYCCSYSLGITPVLPLMMEGAGDFSNRARSIIIGLCISGLYLIAIVNQCLFELLNFGNSPYSAFTIFTIIGSLGLLIVFIYLPVTSSEIDDAINDVIIF
ncbi:uncharacterized protein LOC130678317 [Microplitis mediator]|uniref:uncharacterized protein LOC130678317 n=1 Tax=Microplitis mediator TaxID=375433 RepID=UPI0025560E9D|nr:uncharacterized protein LOC130678317 [Microplitis mediator]